MGWEVRTGPGPVSTGSLKGLVRFRSLSTAGFEPRKETDRPGSGPLRGVDGTDASEHGNKAVHEQEEAEVPLPPFVLHEREDLRNAAPNGRMDGRHG